MGGPQARARPLKTPLPVTLRAAAAADVRSARRSYEQRREGLGERFVASLDEVLRTIGTNAELFQIVAPDRQVRRALTRTFPFAVFYIVERERERVVVLAVLPAAADPARWRARR